MTAAETQIKTNDKLSFFGMFISKFIIPLLNIQSTTIVYSGASSRRVIERGSDRSFENASRGMGTVLARALTAIPNRRFRPAT
ncbi:MAG: hypothetical protein JHD15_11820 [Phenylobacterium sp.]|nr:hypothetical protein [Phenylobacterium sp.]